MTHLGCPRAHCSCMFFGGFGAVMYPPPRTEQPFDLRDSAAERAGLCAGRKYVIHVYTCLIVTTDNVINRTGFRFCNPIPKRVHGLNTSSGIFSRCMGLWRGCGCSMRVGMNSTMRRCVNQPASCYGDLLYGHMWS